MRCWRRRRLTVSGCCPAKPTKACATRCGRCWPPTTTTYLEDSRAEIGCIGAEAFSSLEDPLVGKRLGPWKVGERLGEGGMGVVYRGERDDGAFVQTVALKVVRRGLDTERLVEAFSCERHIIAALDHPDIARPLDAGVTPDGRPYMVMEHVEGMCIDGHCADADLPLAARLDLVGAVCRAVDHAHRRLVVHRDLKPANILVTSTGQVKLLDFGVAKLLDPADPAAASTLTRGAVVPLTPDYASPEQLRGEPVTTATDVFALGVLLYELAAGRRPFARADRSPAELAAHSDDAPMRPSLQPGPFARKPCGGGTTRPRWGTPPPPRPACRRAG